MRPFASRRVLLGVTGGIASYKAGWLARLLAQAGAEVDVVLTAGAQEFVRPLTFEGLTGREVYTDLFAPGHALDHIRLAREADAVVVAPATADFMARAAAGQAGDLLSAILLATEAPVFIVPAMNDRMWAHPQTQRNAAGLRDIGYALLEPETGMLAAGEGSGPGRMPEPETILAHTGRLLEERGSLAGRRVLVTAGPTREPVDPVRFLSNRSTGKMGAAIAAAAWRRGADVTLVAGPLEIVTPVGVRHVAVETTEEMHDAVVRALPETDVLVMAAAPADFRVDAPADAKIKRAAGPRRLDLSPTTDILTESRGARRDGANMVGFALETGDALVTGREKLERKGLDLLVVNDALEPGAGFAVDTNRVTIVRRSGEAEELPLLSKAEVADHLLDRVEELLRGR
jgi:phosphopantothenoylcysteine decarboxylase/phosphopantothenate--cysteine ligase